VTIDLDFLTVFKPDANALLKKIAPHIDDAILANIAACDYGNDVPQHLATLLAIRDTGQVPAPLNWEPREVLELTRWSEPDAIDRSLRWSELPNQRGHWGRAFSCAVLLRAYGDAESVGALMSSSDTLIQLLESLTALTAPVAGETAAFLAWLVPRLCDDPSEQTLALVGLLSVAMELVPPVDDAHIITLAETIATTERVAIAAWSHGQGEYPGVWLRPAVAFDQKIDKWRSLGGTIARNTCIARSTEARDWVQLIGAALETM
jgi:hypothetical protein